MENSVVKHNCLIGVNHRTCPVEVRDKLRFEESEISSSIEVLLSQEYVSEVVLLSTCNRIEIYLVSKEEPKTFHTKLLQLWSELKGVPVKDFEKKSYFYSHGDAVNHLFRVASSLDSLVVGEGQILGQLKESYFLSNEHNGTHFYLNHLFQAAISLGKRVRSETSINEGAVSISFAAVELCKKVIGDLKHSKVGIIGTGEMGELTASNLQGAGVNNFYFINRSVNNAQQLASKFNGEVFGLDEIDSILPKLDIVISSTAAPGFILHKDQVNKALKKRSGNLMILVDIAAPRDLHPDIGDLTEAFLFSIDDLKEVVQENQSKRRESSSKAERIIREEIENFEKWYASLNVIPTVKMLRSHVHDLVHVEVEKLKYKVSEEEFQKIEAFANSITSKLLHAPTTAIKDLNEAGDGKQAVYFLNKFFNLENE